MTAVRIHAIAGLLATLVIMAFLLSTIVVEAIGSHEAVARVKHLIVMPGLFVLVPAMAVTGGTGARLIRGRKGPRTMRKRTRMGFIAANGLLILTPAAILLERWAAAGNFNTSFYLLQVVELTAGSVNLALMALNIRDGFVLSGRLKPRRPRMAPAVRATA